MSIALPQGFCPNGFSLRLVAVQRAFGSPFGGSEQVVDLLQDRWSLSMSLPPRSRVNAAAMEAFINALRGMSQVVYLHHFGRPVPNGTMHGSPTTAEDIGIGWDGFQAFAPPGASLLAGDMIGVSGLLLQVREDCVANGAGAIGIPIVNRTRKPIAAGAAIVWDKPAAPFRLASPAAIQHLPGYADGVSLDFVEDVTL